MRKEFSSRYKCPYSGSELILKCEKESKNGEIVDGHFLNGDGEIFPIINGIPDFTYPKSLKEVDEKTRQTYSDLAKDYDKFAKIPFQTFKSDEDEIRAYMTDKLKIRKGDRILEIGCGDGRGTVFLDKALDGDGEIFAQELAQPFLENAIERLKKTKTKIEFSLANAAYLSFPDNYFNSALHFGGINTFAEVKRCLFELARVVKPGGKVVFGDENMAPWLVNTEMGKIMMNSNPLFKEPIPIENLPLTAGNVKLEWIMMGAFYLLEFTVLENEPKANYHIPIPSKRGGTHWTRYYGNLEGVSDAVKELARKESEKSGLSMSEWLEQVIREKART